jgi:hypothetical protein
MLHLDQVRMDRCNHRATIVLRRYDGAIIRSYAIILMKLNFDYFTRVSYIISLAENHQEAGTEELHSLLCALL